MEALALGLPYSANSRAVMGVESLPVGDSVSKEGICENAFEGRDLGWAVSCGKYCADLKGFEKPSA